MYHMLKRSKSLIITSNTCILSLVPGLFRFCMYLMHAKNTPKWERPGNEAKTIPIYGNMYIHMDV